MPNETEESADNRVLHADKCEPSRWPLIVAIAAGVVTALLSMSLEHSLSLSYGDAGFFITAVLFPGLLGSIAIGGNAHAFSLWIAAGINCIFHFLIVWAICSMSRRVFCVISTRRIRSG
jgi:hypothetical protein